MNTSSLILCAGSYGKTFFLFCARGRLFFRLAVGELLSSHCRKSLFRDSVLLLRQRTSKIRREGKVSQAVQGRVSALARTLAKSRETFLGRLRMKAKEKGKIRELAKAEAVTLLISSFLKRSSWNFLQRYSSCLASNQKAANLLCPRRNATLIFAR